MKIWKKNIQIELYEKNHPSKKKNITFNKAITNPISNKKVNKLISKIMKSN